MSHGRSNLEYNIINIMVDIRPVQIRNAAEEERQSRVIATVAIQPAGEVKFVI